MLHICLRIPDQSFDELPFEAKILEFLRFLGHSAQIRTFTDVNINKLFQPWRSFGVVINKNIDYAFLIWEDFVYQVEHKNHKKSNEMYYPRFTKVVSRHQNTQQYGAILPIELTNEDIRNTKAYKEYYAYASGEAAPKPKASARWKKDEATGSKPRVPDVPSDDSEEEISWNSSEDEETDTQEQDRHDDEGDEKVDDDDDAKEDDEDDDEDDDDVEEIAKMDENDDTESGRDDEEGENDEESDDEETREEESFDPIPRTPEDSEDDGKDEHNQGFKYGEEEWFNEEEADELYHDVDINQGRGLQVSQDIEDSHVTLTSVKPDGQQESSSVSSFVTSMLNPISDAGVESIFAIASSSVAPLPTPTPTMTPSTITTITTATQAPIPPTPIPSEVLQNLPTFDSVFCFNERLKSLEASFSEYRQTNPYAKAVSNILGIVHQYMNQQMNEAVRVAVQIQTDWLHDSYQRENDEFLKTIDDNMKRIIKEQVKIAADLSKMELKKILIEKMEGNKSIQRSDEQRNLYKALVDAYEADKTILDSYGETTILKRRREDDDDQEGPSAGSDRGSTTGFKSRQASISESAFAEEPVQTISQIEEPSHPVFETGSAQTWISELVKQADSRSSFNELLDTPIDFSNFIMNRLGVDTLTHELLAGPTYELMRESCNSLTELVSFGGSLQSDDGSIGLGDFKRLRLQDIEDMLLLLVQGKLSNLTVEERFAFNVSLRMFTMSIVIQRKGDKDRAAAMIQAIDKMLKTRRIMRSLERFVRGRLYEGDFWMLQRTI
uniref:Uncharacterized protein n=1 Tax=Tanacetum cinerariifolium TaxID=118510 RepID=A0A699JAN8_TANCI|nr:hypothetical protein [Tanacetum cinerariifolium]